MATQQKEFWVIGVGASAGGLEALSAFFREVEPHPHAAFIVAQHLAPHAKSMMVELIARQTTLPVIAVKDSQVIEAGHIYIVPPNHDVSIENGELSLTQAGVETRPKPSVDYFFQSLAKAFNRRSVGIILSGTGSDGAEGIRAIKENGGVTLVQSQESAKYDGMPKTSIETGMVDAIMSSEDLGKKLFQILEKRENNSEKIDSHEEIDFSKVVLFLKKEIGADFSQYKMSTIQRRIEKRMARLGQATVKDYYHYLEKNPGEFSQLSQEMLVSVTSFFRDTESFETMGTHLEEIISKKKSDEELRIWSAGCATGEEPYSIAFMVNEILSKHSKSLPVKIFATDLDQDALGQSRIALYKIDDVAGIPNHYLEKYFERKENHFEVKKNIREMIVFAKQDLIQNPPFVKLDMITCRNVLIYFETPLQNRVFDIFHYALKTNGYLFLGKSETANGNLFESVDRKHKIYKKLHAITNLSGQPSHRYTLNTPGISAQKQKALVDSNIALNATAQLLKQFNLSAVVVDDDGVIVHFIGSVSDFISHPVGHADFRLSNLLPRNSATEFSVLLKKTSKEGKVAKSRQYRLEKFPKRSFGFSIQKLENSLEGQRDLFLVSFEMKKIEQEADHKEMNLGDIPKRVLELEQELAGTKENLQTVIEELEISNEELQSLNEELSSTNEELQASNEELETTNEEMQSTNEELTTLNEELNVKSGELRVAHASLENILSSMASPMLVVDRNARLLRYNEQTSQIFHLTFADLGSHIAKASCHCEIIDFEKFIKHTIETGKVSELKCETSQRFYQIRIHPNRDENNHIVGAIVIFFDNTEILTAQERLISSDKRIRSIIDGTPALIFLKDAQGRYLSANKSFEEMFGLVEKDIVGKTDRDILPDDVANFFREGDLEVLFKRKPSERQEEIILNGKTISLFMNRFPLYGSNEKNPYAVGTVGIDVTSQVMMQKELATSESRYKAIIEDQAVFVSRHTSDGYFTFTNKAFCNYFGGTDLSNKSLTFLSIVDDVDKKKVSFEISKLNPESPIVQYEHRVKNHSPAPVRWVRWIHRALYDDNQKITEYQSVGFDTTEIHNKTVELLEKETIFAQVLEHTSDYLSVYKLKDGELYLESFNQSTSKKNLSPNHFLGMSLKDLVDPTNHTEVLKNYERCLKTKSIVMFEEEVPGPSGSRYLSNTMVPILDDDQNVIRVVTISKDISKLKRTELALRDEKHNAESANRAKSDFLASMSHELRTPLNVIMGMSQLLSRSKIPPQQLKLVESISRSSKVLLSLIEDVLDLSRIEAGKIHFDMKPFSLSLMIHDVIQTFETLALEKKIKLSVEEDFNTDLILLGDQVRIKQILINLIGNAIKFTENGTVNLRVQVFSQVSSAPSPIYFEVKDSGIGIEEEAFSKIFKRFSQADSGSARKFGGTGLGLSISKQLVELMNGTIGFESKKGEGSTFWFQVNLQKTTKLEHDLELGHTKFDLRGIKILAVDDSSESLKVLELMLKEAGATVSVAGSGHDALETVMNENLDVVLMDMQMPVMDGLQTTQKIRSLGESYKKLPIIALTANAMPGDRERCLDSGMNDYATKPVQMNILHQLINKWIKK